MRSYSADQDLRFTRSTDAVKTIQGRSSRTSARDLLQRTHNLRNFAVTLFKSRAGSKNDRQKIKELANYATKEYNEAPIHARHQLLNFDEISDDDQEQYEELKINQDPRATKVIDDMNKDIDPRGKLNIDKEQDKVLITRELREKGKNQIEAEETQSPAKNVKLAKTCTSNKKPTRPPRTSDTVAIAKKATAPSGLGLNTAADHSGLEPKQPTSGNPANEPTPDPLSHRDPGKTTTPEKVSRHLPEEPPLTPVPQPPQAYPTPGSGTKAHSAALQKKAMHTRSSKSFTLQTICMDACMH